MKKLILILLAVLALFEGQSGYAAVAESPQSTEQISKSQTIIPTLPSVNSLLQQATQNRSLPQPEQENQSDTSRSKAIHSPEMIEEPATTSANSASDTTNERVMPEQKASKELAISQNQPPIHLQKSPSSTWGEVPWQFDEATGTLTFTGGGTLGDYISSPWNRTDTYKIANTAIKKIIFTQLVTAPENSSYLFSSSDSGNHLYSLKSIDGLNLLNTSKVTDMSAMFYYATSLMLLDLSHFDTSNVVTMWRMFSDAYVVTALDVSRFDTSKVTDMSYMFCNTNLITTLDVSHFNTSKVTNMSYMFNNRSAVTGLDLSYFDTSKVTNMSYMFLDSTHLNSLNLSHFDTSKVTDMSKMFSNTKNLNSLTLGPKSMFRSEVDLPAIPKQGDYTGNWVKSDDFSINMGASSNFMVTYDGTYPGTYVWELGKVDIQSIDPISFGTQTIKDKNSATTRSTITIKDTLPQTANQRWKLMVRYDSTDAQTKQWLATQLKLSFSPHSDQPFLNLPTTLTVGEENQQIAELPDESKKGTQINQSIALNPQLQASGRILVGMYRAQLLWDLEATPTT